MFLLMKIQFEIHCTWCTTSLFYLLWLSFKRKDPFVWTNFRTLKNVCAFQISIRKLFLMNLFIMNWKNEKKPKTCNEYIVWRIWCPLYDTARCVIGPKQLWYNSTVMIEILFDMSVNIVRCIIGPKHVIWPQRIIEKRWRIGRYIFKYTL